VQSGLCAFQGNITLEEAMEFTYSGADRGLQAAAAFANQLSGMDGFWQAISDHPQFDDTTLSSAEIARRLRAVTSAVTVQHWTPKAPADDPDKYDDTVAVTDPNRRYRIYYHTRFLGNSEARKVNTLVHEFVHNVDFFGDGSSSLEYTHRGETVSDNQDTAPYRIGDIAQDFYEQAHQHDPLWKRGEEGGFRHDIAEVADDEIG
jgi:hypothetical protein